MSGESDAYVNPLVAAPLLKENLGFVEADPISRRKLLPMNRFIPRCEPLSPFRGNVACPPGRALRLATRKLVKP